MAGARDYQVDVADVPRYGPPDLSAALFRMISSIPGAYREGQKGAFEQGQRERTERLQEPILDESGQPSADYGTVSRELVKRGGGEMAEKLLPYLWKSQYADKAGSPQPWDQPGAGAQPAADPGARSDSTVPVLRGTSGAAATGNAAPDIDSQGNNRGPTNLRQLAIEAGVDPNTPGFREQFRVGLDAPVDPRVVGPLQQRIASLKQAGMFGPADDQQQPQAPASFNDRFGSAAPPASSPGVPAQGPAPAGPAMASPSAGAGPSGGPGAGLVPAGWLKGGGRQTGFPPTELGYAKWLQSQAERNAVLGFNEAAKGQLEHANKILDAIGAVDPAKVGFERTKNIEGKRTDQAFTNAAAFRKAGQTAEDAAPQLAIAKRLVNSPGFNSGIGTPFVDTMKQLSASLFGDPNAATPSQFYDKLRGGTILNEIRSLSASGAGAVRVPEMKFIDTMIAGRDMQPPSIRSAVEVEDRLNKRVRAIYQLQQEYLQSHPQLDEGFDRVVSKFKDQYPLFSEKEMTHPELMGVPSAPLVHNPQAAMQWAQQMGIKPGDPIRTPPTPSDHYGRIVSFDPAAFK